ncbi:MAG: hypothetical protein LBK99_11515 [Opitutaceae bacterium]|nr:hypothetical protein [Opitutaceae bacterium]
MPPHSVEAEECLLSCCFVDADASLRKCSELRVTPGAFYVPACRRIFEVLLDLHRRELVIDAAVVAEELRRLGKLESVGGVRGIMRVSDAVPTALQVEYFAVRVRELWGLRTMVEFASGVVEGCYEYSGEMRDLVAGMRNRLDRMFEWASVEGDGQQAVATNAAARLEDIMAGRVDMSRWVRLGIPGFDELFSPVDPNNEEWLIIVAGLRSQGKSSLARQLAVANLEGGAVGAVFNLETGARGWLHRAAAMRAGVNLRGADVASAEQKAALRASMGEGSSWVGARLWVFEDVMEIGDIECRVRDLHRATGGALRFIVVDYLQLVELRDARRGMNREQIVGEISRRLKLLGKRYNVACIVLAQFGRSPAKEARRPVLSDLRESASIENNADRVFALWLLPEDRAGIAQDEGTPVPLMQLIQLKNRNGVCGHEHVLFNKRLGRFERAPARGDGRPGAPKPDNGYRRGGGQ